VSIAISGDQRALAEAITAWAERARPVSAVRAGEQDPDSWRALWRPFAALGVLGSALPEASGGGGGTVTDLAVALEQAAAVLVPGPALTTALAGLVLAESGGRPDLLAGLGDGSVTAGVSLDGRLVLGAAPDGVVLLPAGDGWALVAADRGGVKLAERPSGDPSRAVAEITVDAVRPEEELPDASAQRVRDLAVTLAAAEAAGISAWCLRTASEYAKVREQFGRPIGSFQAVKHLCAEMLIRAELAAAVAWDAAECADDPHQHPLAAAVAAALALDAAVENAKDCIQVLGGIGFTWEHDAHLYLRRAVALRQFAGDSAQWRRRVCALTTDGSRRTLRVDLDAGLDRAAVRATVERIAAAPDRRRALADSGYLVPHWPRPHGLDAAPAEQLLIDEELDRAGVTRPDLVIAGWALPTIVKHGSAPQIERFVAPTLRGEIVWCQLFSEPGAGSDLASLRTRAARVEGGWRLSGQKVWTSQAHNAQWGVCLARTDPDAPKHKGITYFLVDLASEGLDIRPLREITGEALFNEVFLDDVFVPDDLVVGDVNGGWPLARTTLAHERVAMGSGSSIGDAVEQLVASAGSSGRADDASVAERLGATIADGLAGSLLDLRTTLRRLDGRADDAGSSVRKLVGVRHRQAVSELALELLGADGLVAGDELTEFLRLRCLSIAGGTTQVLLTLAAERILGLPR